MSDADDQPGEELVPLYESDVSLVKLGLGVAVICLFVVGFSGAIVVGPESVSDAVGGEGPPAVDFAFSEQPGAEGVTVLVWHSGRDEVAGDKVSVTVDGEPYAVATGASVRPGDSLVIGGVEPGQQIDIYVQSGDMEYGVASHVVASP